MQSFEPNARPYGWGFEERMEWLRSWRELVGDDLLGGYATLHYPKTETLEVTDG